MPTELTLLSVGAEDATPSFWKSADVLHAVDLLERSQSKAYHCMVIQYHHHEYTEGTVCPQRIAHVSLCALSVWFGVICAGRASWRSESLVIVDKKTTPAERATYNYSTVDTRGCRTNPQTNSDEV